MTNRALEDYLTRLSGALATLPDEEREAVLAETRAHLEEAIHARMSDAPGADLERITLDETRAFGEPAEIAAARGAAIEEPTTAPRFPWRKVLLGLILVAATALAIGITIDLIDGGPPLSPYVRDDVLANETREINETFVVTSMDPTQRFTLRVYVEREAGCAGVRITDPRGAVVVDDWNACGAIDRRLDLTPARGGQSGEWRVEISYRAFTGALSIDTALD